MSMVSNNNCRSRRRADSKNTQHPTNWTSPLDCCAAVCSSARSRTRDTNNSFGKWTACSVAAKVWAFLHCWWYAVIVINICILYVKFPHYQWCVLQFGLAVLHTQITHVCGIWALRDDMDYCATAMMAGCDAVHLLAVHTFGFCAHVVETYFVTVLRRRNL